MTLLDDDTDDPRCEKCGAPITTGLMAAFCPLKRECALFVDGVEEFMAEFRDHKP